MTTNPKPAHRKKAEGRISRKKTHRSAGPGAKIARYGALLGAMPDLLLEISSRNEYTSIHAQDAGFLTRPPEQAVGKKIEVLFEEGTSVRIAAAVKEARRSRTIQSVEYKLEPPHGPGRWFEGRIVPMKRGKVLLIIRDITDRRCAEANLQAALDDAKRANDEKSRFLAAASHDLRQPLQSAQLFLDVLRQRLTGEEALLAERVGLSLGATAELLNDLLDISRLEAGEIRPCPTRFDIAVLLNDLVVEAQPVAAEKSLRLRCFAPSRFILADRVLLKNMIRNLIGNGLRYTDRGGVLVAARSSSGGGLALEVWDTGRGIPASEQALIFEDFYQIGNPERDRAKGTGLGLSVVRRIAALSGFSISVSSVAGRGSVFRILLPPGALFEEDKGTTPSEPVTALP
ncbi:PAS domain-containing sensor histidine kinase [Telmatospirillum sp. J64-1]|uniref:PAS domain-containing sensor histidine kinase n=1 Tax=Telmatospirillum sp. J64-1 TaxID=2502183 RepID=UPI00115D9816|nr:PAS domain-containing sensor histidine kinase [Telmatospirillum sp. J64-1]